MSSWPGAADPRARGARCGTTRAARAGRRSRTASRGSAPLPRTRRHAPCRPRGRRSPPARRRRRRRPAAGAARRCRSCRAGARRAAPGRAAAGRCRRGRPAPLLATPTTRKPGRALDELRVDARDHEVVVDDQHRDLVRVIRSLRSPDAVRAAPPRRPRRRRRAPDTDRRPDARRRPGRARARHPGPRPSPPWSSSRGGRSRPRGRAARPVRCRRRPRARRAPSRRRSTSTARAADRHRRVHGVVDEVAQHGADVGRRLRVQPGQVAAAPSRRSTPRSAARLVLAISSAATAGSSTWAVTASEISARRRLSVPTSRDTSSYSPSCTSPEIVWSWLWNSWVCARSVLVIDSRALSSLCSASSSVRSRSVVTVATRRPRSSTGLRLTTSTRSPSTTTWSRISASSASRPRTAGSRSRSSTRRPSTSPSSPMSSRALSLSTVIVPSSATAKTPSRIECSSASRWSASAAMAAGSRPRVRRRIRRESRKEPATPSRARGRRRSAGRAARCGRARPRSGTPRPPSRSRRARRRRR